MRVIEDSGRKTPKAECCYTMATAIHGRFTQAAPVSLVVLQHQGAQWDGRRYHGHAPNASLPSGRPGVIAPFM